MIFSTVLAAGFGVRMHRQDLPKPFLMLGSKPIIIHTLEQFFINKNVDEIIVVVANTWKSYAEDLINKYNIFGKEVAVICGGDSKTESVSLVTDYLFQNFKIGKDDIIIAHDAIRPFVTQRMINDNIEAVKSYNAVTTAMITNDTIVVSTDGKHLHEIPQKYTMLAEQTPQTFKLISLHAMFEEVKSLGVDLKNETELARLYMRYGGEVGIVKGEYSNNKIINPYDLEIANALLMEKSK